MGWTRGRQGRASRAPLLAGLLGVLAAGACGGSGSTPPTVALASTYAMQVSYEKLIKKAGVTTFRQLAEVDAAGLEDLATRLGVTTDRIRKEKWVQAAKREHYRKYKERL